MKILYFWNLFTHCEYQCRGEVYEKRVRFSFERKSLSFLYEQMNSNDRTRKQTNSYRNKTATIIIIVILIHSVILKCEVEQNCRMLSTILYIYICFCSFFHFQWKFYVIAVRRRNSFFVGIIQLLLDILSKRNTVEHDLIAIPCQTISPLLFRFYFCHFLLFWWLLFRCHWNFSSPTLIISLIVNCCHGFHNKSWQKSRTILLTKLNFQQFSMSANIFSSALLLFEMRQNTFN